VLANNPVETDHGRLKRGCGRCAESNAIGPRILATGHAFVQNFRRLLEDVHVRELALGTGYILTGQSPS
jgi:hypothetical protein